MNTMLYMDIDGSTQVVWFSIKYHAHSLSWSKY